MPTSVGSVDPTSYASSTNTEGFVLGAVYELGGSLYRFVLNSTDGTTAAGQCCVRASTTAWTCTYSKGASAIATSTIAVGVWVYAVPVSNYGFALIDGYYASVKDSSNGCTAGRQLTPNTTANGDVANKANAYDPVVGVALANGSGGVVKVQVRVG